MPNQFVSQLKIVTRNIKLNFNTKGKTKIFDSINF